MASIIIRSKTFEGWMRANFSASELRDMAEHGVDAGWHGLTYYTDTVKLYERFKDEIWRAAAEDAGDHGYPNAIAFIATWHQDIDDETAFANAMTWYMAERIAQRIADEPGR